MPLQATSGAASYDAFGGGAAAVPTYIESIFSTYLFTGTGSNQTITNNIDLSTKGGLVWTKCRSTAQNNSLVDTVRGGDVTLVSDTTAANDFGSGQGAQSFTSTGYVTGGFSARTYVSWTFREQPKFFDVVTYTGNGTNPRNISHNLGSVPGCVIAKRTDAVSPWRVYHRGISPINDNTLALQSTAAASDGGQDLWGNGATVVVPTSTVFTVSNSLNTNGATYVAYLFAHDAGGFGLTGTDNVISCGSWNGNTTVNLGYEPQWILFRNSGAGDYWTIVDNMRGWPEGAFSQQAQLYANSNGVESSGAGVYPTATGFSTNIGAGNFIYIAIRRGPMKVPTLGTSVFDADTLTPAANLTGTKVTNPFATDLLITTQRDHAGLPNSYAVDRLRGGSVSVATNLTGAEQSWGTPYSWTFDYNDGFLDNFAYPQGSVTTPMIYWSFKRAPGFFDEVCYTGNGTAGRAVAHNLAAVPEFMIIKYRNDVQSWFVFHSFGASIYRRQFLNLTDSTGGSGDYSYGSGGMYQKPDATNFYLEAVNANQSGGTFVAYLFATCPGVSKVGSYTGNGTTQTIDCGFTGGARFVLIKATSTTGNWLTFDTARGMTVLTDPFLSLNSTAAETATLGACTTVATGFAVNEAIFAGVNTTGVSYIFLSVA